MNKKKKIRMLFSEKKKLAEKYEQWCNQIDEKLNNCRIKREDAVMVITFLQEEGFARQSDTIKAFVDKINLVECEMFHKAHDARDSCEEKLNKAKLISDFESERREPLAHIGDSVYQRDNAGNIYKSTIKKIIYETDGIAFDESAIGQGVFLSEEDLKNKLLQDKLQ